MLITSLVPLLQYGSLPRPFELQLNSVTQNTNQTADQNAVWERNPVPGVPPNFPTTQEESGATFSIQTVSPAPQKVIDVLQHPPSITPQDNEENQLWNTPSPWPR